MSKLRFEQNCTNSIDLVDENDHVVGCIHGPFEGDEDVTTAELKLARNVCDGHNRLVNRS